MNSESFDYVIVGAGSAGCVLANLLTENADVKVLVVEAGPADRSIFIRTPAAFSYPLPTTDTTRTTTTRRPRRLGVTCARRVLSGAI